MKPIPVKKKTEPGFFFFFLGRCYLIFFVSYGFEDVVIDSTRKRILILETDSHITKYRCIRLKLQKKKTKIQDNIVGFRGISFPFSSNMPHIWNERWITRRSSFRFARSTSISNSYTGGFPHASSFVFPVATAVR